MYPGTLKRLTRLLLAGLLPVAAMADFSETQLQLHPRHPGDGPFIIEVSGSWPNDCHPGEQKPVIDSFDGSRAVISYEIIVVHVTCNDTETPYRSLIDMSGAARETAPSGATLDIEIHYDDATLLRTVDLVCPQNVGCEASNSPKPETGLYDNPQLANQGLLVARQGAATGIFPLGYDVSGAPEWLYSGSHMVENTFFTKILRLRGGDCIGCPPTGALPEMLPAGYISVLADRPGSLQVKVNDGLFTEFKKSVYGYATFRVGPAGEQTLIDLAGRWAISENPDSGTPLGNLAAYFPGAFEIELDDIVKALPDIQQDGQVRYLVRNLQGDTLGDLLCKGQTDPDRGTNLCEFVDAADQAEPLFVFSQEGPSSLSIEYGRSVDGDGLPPGGKIIRLD